MKIKAAVIRQIGLPQPYAQSRPLAIEEVELAKPGERELLVQVKPPAFAEHCVVNRGSVVKIDARLPFDEAALFGCAVLTGVGAALNTLPVNKLMSDHLRLEQINEGFDRLASGHTVRQIVMFN